MTRARTLLAGLCGLLLAVALAAVVDTCVLPHLACLRLPAVGYLVAALAGAALGHAALGRRPRRALAVLAGGAAALAAASLGVSSLAPVPWRSHCAHRFCDRVLGPGPLQTPFSVRPSCADLSLCANEYPFSAEDYGRLVALGARRGCPPP